MAQKEATVYVIDLGRSMAEKRHGRQQTNLDWMMDYVWDKITTTVITGRKTALIGVVGFRTDMTNVADLVDDDEGYANIRILSPVKQFLMEDIRGLKGHLEPSETDDGDVFSALAIAIQMIGRATSGKTGNRLKFNRRIVVVTDGISPIDDDDLEQISSKIKEDEIEIVLLGVDFDDPDYGFKEEDKDGVKTENETILKQFVEDCGGNFGTLAEAVEQTNTPRVKEVNPMPSYRGQLTLGDASRPDIPVLSIDVERYPCTMVAKPPSASRFIIKTEMGDDPTQSTATAIADNGGHGDQLAVVRNQRVYQVDDPEEPGTKLNVEFEELEKGFEYGRTAVHISASDMDVVTMETKPALELVGFVHQEKMDRYLPMSRSNFVVAQKANDQAKLALSALIHALYENECYAIARLVTKENKPPLLVLLAPYIELENEALIDIELPFAEDMRRYKFPPLDKKLTVSGKVITEHRDLPTDKLMNAMSDYVDALDLSTFGEDDEGNPAEYMKMEETYSPILHRVNQIIRWRATHDTYDALPGPPKILTKYSTPPAELLQKARSKLEALKKSADVKKVAPKQKGRGKRNREHDKPLSGLDVDALLFGGDNGGSNKKRKVRIDQANLIPSFKQALSASDDLESIQAASDDMGAAVKRIITDSFGDNGYGRAVEALRVLREELVDLEEPEIFNKIVRELKDDLLAKELGGDRREFWWRVRKEKLGLIDRKQSTMSDVTEEEAAEFYKVRV